MRISRKEDYAVLLLCALAGSSDSKHRTDNTQHHDWVSLDSTARRFHLPLPFLQQVARDLKRAGLVASREGKNGGYALARPPSTITLSEVLEAISGKLALTQCTTNVACPIERHCLTRQPWRKLHQFVHTMFSSITLDTLAHETTKGLRKLQNESHRHFRSIRRDFVVS